VVVCSLLAPPLAAQWSVGVEIGLQACAGAASDTSPSGNGNTVRPSQGTTYALRVQRRSGAFGAGVGVLYSRAGAEATNEESTVELKDRMELFELAPEFFVVVARPAAGGAVLLHAGVVVDRWSLETVDRNRVAALAAVSLDWPMTDRLSGTFRAGLAVGPSVFEEEEVPNGFERRTTWRRSITAGMQVRL